MARKPTYGIEYGNMHSKEYRMNGSDLDAAVGGGHCERDGLSIELQWDRAAGDTFRQWRLWRPYTHTDSCLFEVRLVRFNFSSALVDSRRQGPVFLGALAYST